MEDGDEKIEQLAAAFAEFAGHGYTANHLGFANHIEFLGEDRDEAHGNEDDETDVFGRDTKLFEWFEPVDKSLGKFIGSGGEGDKEGDGDKDEDAQRIRSGHKEAAPGEVEAEDIEDFLGVAGGEDEMVQGSNEGEQDKRLEVSEDIAGGYAGEGEKHENGGNEDKIEQDGSGEDGEEHDEEDEEDFGAGVELVPEGIGWAVLAENEAGVHAEFHGESA